MQALSVSPLRLRDGLDWLIPEGLPKRPLRAVKGVLHIFSVSSATTAVRRIRLADSSGITQTPSKGCKGLLAYLFGQQCHNYCETDQIG